VDPSATPQDDIGATPQDDKYLSVTKATSLIMLRSHTLTPLWVLHFVQDDMRGRSGRQKALGFVILSEGCEAPEVEGSI